MASTPSTRPATRRHQRTWRSPRPPAPTPSRPRAPTNVTVSTRTTTSISLTWAPSTDNIGVVGYELYRGGVLVGETAGTTGIVSGLTCGTNYTLGIDAYDAAGNDSAQTVVMVSTLACADTTAPTQPTNLRLVLHNHHQRHARLERLHRQRRRHRLRHLPRHHQGRLDHHNHHLHDHRAHLRNHLHHRRPSLRQRRQRIPAGDNLFGHHLTLPQHPRPRPAFPDASNTGVPAGTTLTAYTGPSTISTPNTVIDGKTMGCINVTAGGVIIRNSRIACNGSPVNVDDPRALRQDTLADRGLGDQLQRVVRFHRDRRGRHSSPVVLTSTGCENGLSINQNITLEDSFVHDLYRELHGALGRHPAVVRPLERHRPIRAAPSTSRSATTRSTGRDTSAIISTSSAPTRTF